MPTFFRLLDNTETVERSGRKLEQGQQLLEESHDVGVTILNDLATQRETLTRARNRVSNKTSSLSYFSPLKNPIYIQFTNKCFALQLRDTDSDLGTSSRILSGMIVRIQQSKIILSLIGAIIICVIIYGVYRSFEG